MPKLSILSSCNLLLLLSESLDVDKAPDFLLIRLSFSAIADDDDDYDDNDDDDGDSISLSPVV